jgi:hypothetical protein
LDKIKVQSGKIDQNKDDKEEEEEEEESHKKILLKILISLKKTRTN